jgi:hypothetical protein
MKLSRGPVASVLMLMKLSSSTDGRSALLDKVAATNANNDGPAAIDNHHNAAEHTPPRQFPRRLALTEDSATLILDRRCSCKSRPSLFALRLYFPQG